MKGLSWSSIKRNPSLLPLFAITCVGVSGAVFYPLRCALKSPDVAWNKAKKPWEEYSNKDYKFYHTDAMKEAVKVSPPKY